MKYTFEKTNDGVRMSLTMTEAEVSPAEFWTMHQLMFGGESQPPVNRLSLCVWWKNPDEIMKGERLVYATIEDVRGHVGGTDQCRFVITFDEGEVLEVYAEEFALKVPLAIKKRVLGALSDWFAIGSVTESMRLTLKRAHERLLVEIVGVGKVAP